MPHGLRAILHGSLLGHVGRDLPRAKPARHRSELPAMDGALARPARPPTTSSHPAEKLPSTRKNLQFPELIGPLVATAPAVLHAIFMNQSCLYLGVAGRIVKQGHHWRALPASTSARARQSTRRCSRRGASADRGHRAMPTRSSLIIRPPPRPAGPAPPRR